MRNKCNLKHVRVWILGITQSPPITTLTLQLLVTITVSLLDLLTAQPKIPGTKIHASPNELHRVMLT